MIVRVELVVEVQSSPSKCGYWATATSWVQDSKALAAGAYEVDASDWGACIATASGVYDSVA